MTIKTHLADSSEPLVEGSKLLAICGAIVPDAAFVFMWDESEANIDMTFLKVCRKCKEGKLTGRYVYGIVSGQESVETHAGKIIDESIAMVEKAEKRSGI